MFLITYLRRELHRRRRQAVVIALGLALGVGLVVTVSAASAGVTKAESGVLGGLYGVGTNVTVTGPPVPTGRFGQARLGNTGNLYSNASATGSKACQNGKCVEIPAGHTIQCLQNGKCAELPAGQSTQSVGPPYTAFTSADVAAAARLHDVSAAAGGLLLSVGAMTIMRPVAHPTAPPGQPGGDKLPTLSYFSVDGVDTGRPALSPLSAGTITSGHPLTAADAHADVAVVDSGYAASNNLRVGSAITLDSNPPLATGVRFTVIGIVRQPQTGGSPDDVYIPLAAAQALVDARGSAETGEVNMISLTAASAADIPAVQHEIAALLPHDTITTAASLASEVTGSVTSAAKLANDLGRWLAVLVLIAAFAMACLLTIAAVTRRAREFGMLKALGWRTRRIIAQVLGESLAMGVAGAVVGVGLGFAGEAIIAAAAPAVSATVPAAAGAVSQAAVPGGPTGELDPATASHVLTAVPLHPAITAGVIGLAVLLAVAGGLLAGSFGAWRIARLRPADALARVT
jgi:putative ABC transport system permease protein